MQRNMEVSDQVLGPITVVPPSLLILSLFQKLFYVSPSSSYFMFHPHHFVYHILTFHHQVGFSNKNLFIYIFDFSFSNRNNKFPSHTRFLFLYLCCLLIRPQRITHVGELGMHRKRNYSINHPPKRKKVCFFLK